MNEQININEITDIKELKVLLADNFVTRENAMAAKQEAENNINVINARIVQLQSKNIEIEQKSKAKK